MKVDGVLTFWKNDFFKAKNMKSKIESCITTNQLKILFNKEAKIYYHSKNRDFEVDENNVIFLNLICKYFARDPSFESEHLGDLSKGLYVCGPNGTGKSSSFKIIQNISIKYQLKSLWFPIIETYKVVEKFNIERQKDFVTKNYSKGRYLFDDLGAEVEANNNFVFGKDDIFAKIMQSRYDEFIRKGTFTHITSNLNIEQIRQRYGSRVEDRFVEMFNLLELNGESKR